MNTLNINAESDANIIGDDSSPTLTLENTHASGVALALTRSAAGAATVATVRVTNSVASGAFFEFTGFLASIASAGSIVRGVRVKYGDNYGFIPVYASGTYI